MKKITITTTALFFLSSLIIVGLTGFNNPEDKQHKSKAGGEVTFTVRTVTENGNFAPRHVLAIWVEDANGFVKTRKAMANQRIQYLYTWKAVSDFNVVDAITGSTINSHQTHTVSWDCTDLEGEIVPNGDYDIWIEFTEKHAQGPLFNLTFTVGPDAQTLTPPDEAHFKDIELEFTPGFVGVEDIALNEIIIYPNPGNGVFNIQLAESEDIEINIYDQTGRVIESKSVSEQTSGTVFQIDLSKYEPGVYFAKFSSQGRITTHKLIVQ